MLTAVLAMVASCKNTEPLRVDDDHASSASLRLNWRFGESGAARPREGAGLELGLERYRGGSNQTLGSGQRLVVGNLDVTGPQVVHHEATVRHAYIDYSYLVSAGARVAGAEEKRRFEIDLHAGLGSFDSTIDSLASAPGSTVQSNGVSVRGAQGGLGLRLWVTERVALESRFLVAARSSDIRSLGFNGASGEADEVALVVYATKNLALRAGYARVELVVPDSGNSDIHVFLGGPHLGLMFQF